MVFGGEIRTFIIRNSSEILSCIPFRLVSFPPSLTASADDAATLSEMLDQPAVVAGTIESAAGAVRALVADIAAYGPARIVLAGAGDSLADALPAAEPSLAPLLYLPPAHLIGYHLTMAKLTATAAEQGGDR
jgi:hypothetical protein